MMNLFLRLLSNPLISLMFRYGIVGVIASIIHFSIALFAYKYANINFFASHFIGFVFGLFTAYFGHYFYSFKDGEDHSKRFPKFLVTALVALILHQGGAYLMVHTFNLDYSTRVLPALIVVVPVFTFLLNKFWVFSNSDEVT